MNVLEYTVGDLVLAAQSDVFDVIAHQCNIMCNMGSGIAPQIKKAFPIAGMADDNTKIGDRSKLGTFSMGSDYTLTGEDILIYNLYGQAHWNGRLRGKRCTDYIALAKALDKMKEDLLRRHENANEITLGLPKLGAGLGGGDWNIVEELINDSVVAAGIDTTIYVLSSRDLPSKNQTRR